MELVDPPPPEFRRSEAGSRRVELPFKSPASRRRLWASVEDVVVGACDSYDAFDATSAVQEAGVKLLDEYKRHPSFRALLQDDYQVLTF